MQGRVDARVMYMITASYILRTRAAAFTRCELASCELGSIVSALAHGSLLYSSVS